MIVVQVAFGLLCKLVVPHLRWNGIDGLTAIHGLRRPPLRLQRAPVNHLGRQDVGFQVKIGHLEIDDRKAPAAIGPQGLTGGLGDGRIEFVLGHSQLLGSRNEESPSCALRAGRAGDLVSAEAAPPDFSWQGQS